MTGVQTCALPIFFSFGVPVAALVATGTPKEKSGQVLGTLATGSVTGTLLGDRKSVV